MQIDFVVITPLEEERAALLEHLQNPRRLPPTNDDIRVYYAAYVPVTFMDGSGGHYSVMVTDSLGMGLTNAAHVTSDAIRRWRPRYVVLVGIAGGLASNNVNLGDVLIADQIADYELQKLTAEKTLIRWSVHKVDPRLFGAAKDLPPESWNNDIQIRAERPEKKNLKPHCHIGPICTGNKVIANGLMTNYSEIWTKLIGVEMEGGGAAGAAFQAPIAPGFFMVRGVSDLADVNKDKNSTLSWRTYACNVAASYFVALLKSGPIPLSAPLNYLSHAISGSPSPLPSASSSIRVQTNTRAGILELFKKLKPGQFSELIFELGIPPQQQPPNTLSSVEKRNNILAWSDENEKLIELKEVLTRLATG